jgi:hypothetical protein
MKIAEAFAFSRIPEWTPREAGEAFIASGRTRVGRWSPINSTMADTFEVFSRRYERSATLVTSNLPFNEWTEAFGSERLTGALLDRLTHTSTSWR